MHKKAIFILTVVTLLTFSNALFNGFVGDDEIVIVKNTFYKSWSNFPVLFTKDYLTDSRTLFISTQENNYSGSVAYRPVLSTTYFFDYWLWKLNPFGYHLHNLILHILNVALVYFLIHSIIRNNNIALFSSLLFSLHPVKAEAVCGIGYRADVLASFFVLLSFSFFLQSVNQAKARSIYYGLSILSYFLALFSKESAIVLPVILVAYDKYFKDYKLIDLARNLKSRYLGFIIITLFYLYIYLKVLPNTTLNDIHLIGGNQFSHVISIFWIFTNYVIVLSLPFLVKMTPPLYAPDIHAFIVPKILFSVGLFFIFAFITFKSYRKFKEISFFLFWFLISMIPVSNIIPLANPMAHRFLYFPSIGFMAVVGILIEKLCIQLNIWEQFSQLEKIMKMGIIGLCVVVTFPLNALWRNNYTVATALIENYPDDQKGYSILGIEYFKTGQLEQAKNVLNKSVELGTNDPRIYYMLGMCFLEEPQKAVGYFKKSIGMYPNYVAPYIGIGRMYFLQSEYKKSIQYFKKSINILPTYTAYGYLMQIYLGLGRYDEARAVLVEAKKALTKKEQIESLQEFLGDEH